MTNDQTPPGNMIRARWLNPRRKRFWAIILFLAYILFGFFAMPPLLHNAATSLLQDDLGRNTSIAKIRFNPLALSLRVQGFEMHDTDGARLAAFAEFHANFQWTSLLKWAWTFSDVQLRSPYFHFERFDTGDTRLGRLLEDFAALKPDQPEPAPEQDGRLPRLLFRNVLVENATIDAIDNLPATRVEMQFTPINMALQELSTIPDQQGRKTITIQFPGGASFRWSGSIALTPLDARGELALKDLRLDPLAAYLDGLLPLESVSANLSSSFAYHLSQAGDAFNLDIDDLEIVLNDIHATGLEPSTRFIDIGEVALLDGKLRLQERSLYFGKARIGDPRISAWLDEDGRLSLEQLVPPTAEAAPETTAPSEPALPWHLGVGEFVLDGGRLSFTDYSISPNAAVTLTGLQGRVMGINNEPGVSMPFELAGGLDRGGSYDLEGSMTLLPGFSLSGNASTHSIPLSVAQPYAEQFAFVALEGGVLNSTLEVTLAGEQGISIGGSVQLPDLEVSDTIDNNRLLGWKMLDIDRFDLDGRTLHISRLSFNEPYGRLAISEDMDINVAKIVKSSPAQAPAATDKDRMDLIIGGIRVEQGSMDFSDFSLPLPFATYVTDLGGRISTIATNSAEPAHIHLEGQVDDYGLARIDGSMNTTDPVRHTDVMVEFRNLLMSSLSPYTVAFAGRGIEQGKLDLDLEYKIEQGRLLGENDVVLSDLVLGEKVDHPDAASLPLGLAVSLLKDADGVIRIDLPVEGDVNDPAFRIGGVIWQAFTGLITKIVSSPFKLLGNLIGVESEDFGQFEFLAGRSDLTPPELEKVAQLAQAIQQRPELVIEVNGATDPGIDVPATKRLRLIDAVNQRLQKELGYQADESLMLDEEIRAVIEAMFAERFPDMPPASLKPLHTAPPPDDPEGKPVLDALAYAHDMWDRLLEAEIVSDEDLAALAAARATGIRDAFLAGGNVDSSRITLGESAQVESEDGEWVTLELGVTSG
jgi:hypothetical protein